MTTGCSAESSSLAFRINRLPSCSAEITRRATRTRPRSSISIGTRRSRSASSTRSRPTSRLFSSASGVKKGSRVLLLSDECLEKLLIWFGAWRIGAVVCPLNIEINEKMMVDADGGGEPRADPLPQGPRRGGAGRRPPGAAHRFGRWSPAVARIPATSSSRRCTRRRDPNNCPSATTPTTSPASSAPRARRRGRRSSSTITPPIG